MKLQTNVAMVFFCLCMYAHAFAQDWQQPLANQMGMGFAPVAPQAQPSGAVGNPAGLSGITTPTAQMGTGILHGIFQLQAHTALVAGNGWGVAISHWGTSFFGRQTAGFSAGGKLGNITWGTRLTAYQWTAEYLPSNRRIGIDMGAVVPLAERLRLGAYISQLSWGKSQPWALYQLPLVWQVGLEGNPHEKLAWAVSLRQESMGAVSWQAGLQYHYGAHIKWMAGVASQPMRLYAGALYAHGRAQFSYALSRHAVLGLSQTLTVAYALKKG